MGLDDKSVERRQNEDSRADDAQTRCLVYEGQGRSRMETKFATWQERFSLTTCTAQDIEKSIPPTGLGMAVIYAKTDAGEDIFLVVESRSGSLRSQCMKRLQTAKLPPLASLLVSFKAVTLADTSPEAVHAACRQQVLLAGEICRELRPAMR